MPEQDTWTAEELRAFLDHVAGDRQLAMWRFATFTGVRRGELVGLRWRDVDLDAARAFVVQQRAKAAGTVNTGRLKGKRGRARGEPHGRPVCQRRRELRRVAQSPCGRRDPCGPQGPPSRVRPPPCVDDGLAVQPVVLRQIVGREGFRGRGLLARFLYAVPRSTIGRRMVAPPPVPEAVRTAYQHTITTLARSLTAATEPLPVLSLDEPARVVLRGFAAELEACVGDDGDLGHIRDWAGKLVGAVVRIAGLLHVAGNLSNGWNRPVAEPTVPAAIRLGRYFAAHAVAAFDLMNADPLVRGARLTLRWIHERDEPFAQVSQRDAHRALRPLNLSRRIPHTDCCA